MAEITRLNAVGFLNEENELVTILVDGNTQDCPGNIFITLFSDDFDDVTATLSQNDVEETPGLRAFADEISIDPGFAACGSPLRLSATAVDFDVTLEITIENLPCDDKPELDCDEVRRRTSLAFDILRRDDGCVDGRYTVRLEVNSDFNQNLTGQWDFGDGEQSEPFNIPRNHFDHENHAYTPGTHIATININGCEESLEVVVPDCEPEVNPDCEQLEERISIRQGFNPDIENNTQCIDGVYSIEVIINNTNPEDLQGTIDFGNGEPTVLIQLQAENGRARFFQEYPPGDHQITFSFGDGCSVIHDFSLPDCPPEDPCAEGSIERVNFVDGECVEGRRNMILILRNNLENDVRVQWVFEENAEGAVYIIPANSTANEAEEAAYSHFYRPGSHTAILKVLDEEGNEICRKEFLVEVRVCPCVDPDIGEISIEAVGDCNSENQRTVLFVVDFPEQDITDFLWTFHDAEDNELGSVRTSFEQNPTGQQEFTFDLPDHGSHSFTAQLTVFSGECQTTTPPLEFTLEGCGDPPIVECPTFGPLTDHCACDEDRNGIKEFRVVHSGAGNDTFIWDFGDGSPEVISGTPVRHRYSDPGPFRVTVKPIVDVPEGCDDLEEQVLENVLPDCPDCPPPDCCPSNFWHFLLAVGIGFLAVWLILFIFIRTSVCSGQVMGLMSEVFFWSGVIFAGLGALMLIICFIRRNLPGSEIKKCPTPCGLLELYLWRGFMTAGVSLVYFTLCCPTGFILFWTAMALIGLGLVFMVVWMNRCDKEFCQLAVHISDWLIYSGGTIFLLILIFARVFSMSCVTEDPIFSDPSLSWLTMEILVDGILALSLIIIYPLACFDREQRLLTD